jgi:urease accessory protein
MIIEHVVPPPVDLGNRRIERLVLTSAEMAKHRQRGVTDAGREVGIALPHGSTLRDGDVLHLDEMLAIVIQQAEEELLRLLPRTPSEFALAGYQVGNLHRAAMIDARAVTVLYDKAVEALAERWQIPFEKGRGRFRPVQNSGHVH